MNRQTLLATFVVAALLSAPALLWAGDETQSFDPLAPGDATQSTVVGGGELPRLPDGEEPQLTPDEQRRVDERLGELQRRLEEQQREIDELKALREKDQAEFDRRMDDLERRQNEADARDRSMAGRLDQIGREMETGRSSGSSRPGEPGTTGGGSNGTTGANPSANGGGLETPPPEKKPTWWDRILESAAKGAGKGLAKVARRKLADVRDDLDRMASEEDGRVKWALMRSGSDMIASWVGNGGAPTNTTSEPGSGTNTGTGSNTGTGTPTEPGKGNEPTTGNGTTTGTSGNGNAQSGTSTPVTVNGDNNVVIVNNYPPRPENEAPYRVPRRSDSSGEVRVEISVSFLR